MKSLISLLPGESHTAAPARWHYLGAAGVIQESLACMGLHVNGLHPHRLFSHHDVVVAKLLAENGITGAALSNGLAAYESRYLKPDELAQVREGGQKTKANGRFKLHPTTWRWCPECVIHDEDVHGVTYYHRDHQIPGVFHCQVHNVGLVSGCSACGFCVTNLVEQNIPPSQNICPHCHCWMSAYDGVFTQTMAAIESSSLSLVQSNALGAELAHSVQRVRAHAGLQRLHSTTVAERKKLTSWLDAFAAYFTPAEINSYFTTPKVIRGRFSSPYLRSARLYDINTFQVPLPPLVHLMAAQFIAQTGNQSHVVPEAKRA